MLDPHPDDPESCAKAPRRPRPASPDGRRPLAAAASAPLAAACFSPLVVVRAGRAGRGPARPRSTAARCTRKKKDHGARAGRVPDLPHGARADPGGRGRDPVYRCPMHPQIQQAGAGSCRSATWTSGASRPRRWLSLADMPAGTAAITLGLDRLQAIGARDRRRRRARVRRRAAQRRLTEFSRTARRGSTCARPASSRRSPSPRPASACARAQVLAEYYSPEIYQAQAELLAAGGWSGPVVGAARQRLELLGLSSAQSRPDRSSQSKPDRTTPVVAPASGVVVARTAVLGAYVQPEEPSLRAARGPRALPGRRAAGRAGRRRPSRRVRRDMSDSPADPRSTERSPSTWSTRAVSADSRSVRVRMPLDNDNRALVAGMPAVVALCTAGRDRRGGPARRDRRRQQAALRVRRRRRRPPGPAPRSCSTPRDDEFVRVREGVSARRTRGRRRDLPRRRREPACRAALTRLPAAPTPTRPQRNRPAPAPPSPRRVAALAPAIRFASLTPTATSAPRPSLLEHASH